MRLLRQTLMATAMAATLSGVATAASAAGTRTPDPYLDGARSINSPRDVFTDGARSGSRSGRRTPDPFFDGA
jgi:hypothetical protein